MASLRFAITTVVFAFVGAVALPSATAKADVPLYTPSLQISSGYTYGPQFTANVSAATDALPTYSAVLADASGRSVPLLYAYPQSAPYSAYYQAFGFQSAEALTTGASYKVALVVKTVGYYACSIYDKNGCSWQDPESVTYQWTFTYTGAALVAATPYYDPLATSVQVPKSRLASRTGLHFTLIRGIVRVGYPGQDGNILSALAPRRLVVFEGLRGHKWVALKHETLGGNGSFRLRLRRDIRRVRVQVPAASVPQTDGGLATYQAGRSRAIHVPR